MSDNKTINGIPVAEILKPHVFQAELVERIAHRKVKPTLEIVEPDTQWPAHFQTLKSRILSALTPPSGEAASHQEIVDPNVDPGAIPSVLAVNHVGSTSVPDLPAKPVIDIDLMLSSNSLASEAFYVPRLEAAGFQFLLREPAWHGHRFFVGLEPMSCNLHVWGPRCPEVEKHRIFREWMCEHADDRASYARVKRECAVLSREKGETQDEYNLRKEWIIKDILKKAFTALGVWPEEAGE